MKVAVLDIGKTNAKVALVDMGNMAELAVLTRPNTVLLGPPYPHFDIEVIWSFFLDSLHRIHAELGVDEISITAHGASIVLLTADGDLACPMLDYEHDGPQSLAQSYDEIRPAFADSGSPRLPLGLNVGAQLHWLLEKVPGLQDRAAQVVTYPQYWSGRLTGYFATEPTSLGCHTDLWLPNEGRFSDLPQRLGLSMAPLAAANDVAGRITPEVAAATGLPAGTQVRSGIHDSNASLLPYLHHMEGAFSVVSTGTWVICMSVNGDTLPLDPARDTLVNVNAYGDPVPSARFMGGREYELMQSEIAPPTAQDIASVLSSQKALLPPIECASGPFAGRGGGWSDAAMTPGEKGAALSFYLAMMTSECLDLIGAGGPVVVEGPFGRNDLYLDMLAAQTGRRILVANSATGTSVGAALLCDPTALGTSPLSEPKLRQHSGLLPEYGQNWRGIAERRGNTPS
jgi:sugar (pentulose or hexulose) kinase